VKRWVGLLAVCGPLGCTDFSAGEMPASSTDATSDAAGATSSTGGSTSGSVDSAGGTSGAAPDDDGDPGSTSSDAATSGSPPESSSSGEPDQGSSSGEASFPYAGDYVGTFSGACQINVQGQLMMTVTEIGSAVGSASAKGQSTPLIGTVSEMGALAIDISLSGLECSMAGTLADDASGGTGTFSCPSVGCNGGWSLSGA
jgi:hypothetical protein